MDPTPTDTFLGTDHCSSGSQGPKAECSSVVRDCRRWRTSSQPGRTGGSRLEPTFLRALVLLPALEEFGSERISDRTGADPHPHNRRSDKLAVVSSGASPLQKLMVSFSLWQHAILHVHALVRADAAGNAWSVVSVAPVRRSERIIAGTECISGDGRSQVARRPVQRTRVASCITDIFTRGLWPSETQEHPYDPRTGDLRRSCAARRGA